MKPLISSSSFTSRMNAIILWAGLIVSVSIAGLAFGQSLSIPTNLNNAMITIKQIFLSSSGVGTNLSGTWPNKATIALDWDSGTITTSSLTVTNDASIADDLTLSKYAPTCGGATGCILKIDNTGRVQVTTSVNSWITASGQDSLWGKTNGTEESDIFFKSVNTASDYNNGRDIKVRIGVKSDSTSTWSAYSPDAQLIVNKEIESRQWFRLKTTASEAGDIGTISNNTDHQSSLIRNDNLRNSMILSSTRKDSILWDLTGNIILQSEGGATQVGINTPSTSVPQKSLDVVGDAAISQSLTIGHLSTFNPGTDKLAVNGSTRANAYYYNSDRRYKSDIVRLTSSLESLLKLSGYSYFNKLSQKTDIGIIAQDVEAVYPALVQTDAAGYKSVQYGNLVAPIIEAIRELSTKIDNLFTAYVSQQERIDALEARILQLEGNR